MEIEGELGRELALGGDGGGVPEIFSTVDYMLSRMSA